MIRNGRDSVHCPFVSRTASFQTPLEPGERPSRSGEIVVSKTSCVSGGRTTSGSSSRSWGAPSEASSLPTRKAIWSIPQSSKRWAATANSSSAVNWISSDCGSSTTSDGGRSTVATISTAGCGRLRCPCGLANSSVAHGAGARPGGPPGLRASTTAGSVTGTAASQREVASPSSEPIRVAAISPMASSMARCSGRIERTTRPGRSRNIRPESMLKVIPPIALPTRSGTVGSGTVSRAHVPGSGSGPATTRGTRRSAAGPAASSPHTTSTAPPSWTSCIDSRRGGSFESLRTRIISERSSSPSFGTTSGWSFVRISSGRPSAGNVNDRSPPAAWAVLHFHGAVATASRGRSSSNQGSSSNCSTSVVSTRRARRRTTPEEASPVTVASNSTVPPTGASIRAASGATRSGSSIRM